MVFRNLFLVFVLILATAFHLPTKAIAFEQPTAIFHPFHQSYNDVEKFVCTLADQVSPIQISPT